ncbi:MAG TPA: GNAT family N-acetyltransferase [Streptosporangiaceae bacterium]
MVEVRAVGPEDWRIMRDVRLAALRDAPYAFASTYEREARLAEAEWRRRASTRNSFLAYLPELGGTPAGIAAGFEEEPGAFELVSMWVRPGARGHTVGSALINVVARWARDRGASALHLWVTESNKPARRLYERSGFTPTGERQPLPSDPALSEIGMTRPV